MALLLIGPSDPVTLTRQPDSDTFRRHVSFDTQRLTSSSPQRLAKKNRATISIHFKKSDSNFPQQSAFSPLTIIVNASHKFKDGRNMCMNTNGSRGTLLEVRKAPRPSRRQKADRLGVTHFVKYARGFAFAVMVVAYVGQGTEKLTGLVVGIAEDSILSSSWVFLYMFLVWVILKQNWYYFLQNFQELTGRTNESIKGEVSVLGQAPSSETLAKLRMSSMRLFSMSHAQLQHEGRYLAISAKETFLSLSVIEDLTLNDLKELFRYSIECNMTGFDRSAFVSNMRRSAQRAVEAVDFAAQESRGPRVKPSKAGDSWDYGEVDAFVFMAVIRIFAEWRNLRLVPDGYQRYAVGMNIARRDLLQNVNKMETAAHEWFAFHERDASADTDSTSMRSPVASPTLRQLLEHEIGQNKHSQLPRINDKSAASGFLWIKRQVDYQTAIFANTVKVPIFFPSSKAAVTSAYKQVYEDYHGFFVKAIFQNSFEAAPEPEIIMHFMNLPAMNDDCDTEPGSDDEFEDCDSWVHLEVEKDAAPVDFTGWTEEPEQHPLEQFGNHVASEWGRFQGFIDQCRGVNMNRHESRNAMAVGSSLSAKKAISRQASQAAQDDIPSYMNIVQPLIAGLDGLIEELNINDPTKV